MKKVYFLLIFIFLFFLTGCNNNEENEFGNSKTNQKYYDMLVERLNETEQKINESGYLTMTVSTNVDGKPTKQVIRAANDPLYMEIPTEYGFMYIVQEGENVYSYEPDSYNKYDKKFMAKLSEFETPENDVDSDALFETTFDSTKCSVELVGDTFTTKSYYKDALNDEGKKILERIFRGYDSELTSLYNTMLTTKYIFYSGGIEIKMNMKYLVLWYVKYIDIEVSIKLSYKEFERFNFEDIKDRLNYPNSFEDIEDVTDIKDTTISFKNVDDLAYLKINVPKGLIVFKGALTDIRLYDMNKRLIDADIRQINVSNEYTYYLPIEEKGDYYLRLENLDYKDHDLTISVIENGGINDYQKYEIINNTIYEGQINSSSELDKFTYQKNSEEKTIKISNLGKETIHLFLEGEDAGKNMIDINPNQTRYINIDKEEVNIYFCERLSQKESNGYLYKVKFEVLDEKVSNELVEGEIKGKNTLANEEKRIHHVFLKKNVYCIKGDFKDNDFLVQYNDGKYTNSPISIVETSCGSIKAYHIIVTIDNWYDINIINNSGAEGTFTFSKHSANTSLTESVPAPNIGEGTNNAGLIKYKEEYVYYLLNNDTEKTKYYVLTNNLDEQLRLIIVRSIVDNFSSNDITILPGEKTLIPVDKKVKLIVSNIDSSKTVNYDFTLVELDNSNYANKEEYENVVITKEFSDNYFVGFEGIPTYAKIILEEEGIIGFVYENHPLYGESKFNFTLYTLNGESVSSGNVAPGEYMVCFENRSSGCVYAKIKYALVSSVPVKEVVELKELDESNNNDRYSDIYNRKILIDQDIKYYFNLDKKTSVCFDPYIVYIYSSTGTLLSCPATDTMERRDDYIILPAGEYYFTTPKLDGDSEEEQIIPIGIKETTNDSPLDITEMQTLYEGTSFKVDVEKGKSVKYFKLFTPSFMKIKLSYGEGQGYLYRINGTNPTELGDDWIYLNGGTYILMVVYDVDDARTVIIKAERGNVYS